MHFVTEYCLHCRHDNRMAEKRHDVGHLLRQRMNADTEIVHRRAALLFPVAIQQTTGIVPGLLIVNGFEDAKSLLIDLLRFGMNVNHNRDHPSQWETYSGKLLMSESSSVIVNGFVRCKTAP